MSWFEKIMPSRIKTEREGRTRSVPEGLWIKCEACDAVLYRPELERNLSVCPKCSHHMRINARDRLKRFLDTGSASELAASVTPEDPLKFRDQKKYKDRLLATQKSVGETDALIVMAGTLQGLEVVAAAFEFRFMGGSMGVAVGEALIAAAELACLQESPLIVLPSSGGARMQEGILSLMQMARTTVAVDRVRDKGLPYIVVLTDPTTGGVTASFAMLGDVALAEPGAIIGFAGARVIEQTIREKLPEGFQRAEYLMEHGMVDMVVHRQELRARLIQLIGLLLHKNPAADVVNLAPSARRRKPESDRAAAPPDPTVPDVTFDER